MPFKFKCKSVKGVPVKRMTGSSRIKLEKKAEQRNLRQCKDWRGMIERYSTEGTMHGTAIIISQAKFEKEGPLVFRPWTDGKLKRRLSNPVLAFMQKSDLLLISKKYRIPLRIVERLQRREMEAIAREIEVLVEDPKPRFLVRTKGEIFEAEIEPLLLPNGKPKPFEYYSDKDLASIYRQIGIPMPLLKHLRERERNRIRRAKGLIGKIKKEGN
ncbi:MAG: hypothetical protein QXK06_01610 [Candidatus Diapherotrites archaeon]